MSNNQKMFSRITSSKFFYDTSDMKSNEVNEAKILSNLNLWANEFQASFLPPPPRPNFDLTDLQEDGLTSCDLCSWSTNGEKKGYYSIETNIHESSNHTSWIFLMIVVSFCSAILGAIISWKYRRSNSVRAFSTRGCGSKKPDSDNQNLTQPKKTSIDLQFFMEENNADDIYATLDQISLNSDNMNESYQGTGFSKRDEIPSAPSSAYYSGASVYSGADKQYESIDHFATLEKASDYNKNTFEKTFITLNNNNRLSAISENNFSGNNNSDNNSEYV